MSAFRAIINSDRQTNTTRFSASFAGRASRKILGGFDMRFGYKGHFIASRHARCNINSISCTQLRQRRNQQSSATFRIYNGRINGVLSSFINRQINDNRETHFIQPIDLCRTCSFLQVRLSMERSSTITQLMSECFTTMEQIR